MTTREQWLALADRCEKATGPDREIDAVLHDAFNPPERPDWSAKNAFLRWGGGVSWIVHYTASLDAITALIERELPDHAWNVENRRSYYAVRPCGQIWTREIGSTKHGSSATPALALCAAFAKAMANKEQTP